MSRKDWRRPEVTMPEGMRRIRLTISYDGSLFHGWQRQNGEITVQETIENALSDLLSEKVSLAGSGRTDAGVHALGQVAHFDTMSALDASKYAVILNSRLPSGIRILSSEECLSLFHARFTAQAREYWYHLKEWSDMLPFDFGHYAAVRKFPDITMLEKYASALQGTHDYTTFCSASDPSPSRRRDIYVSEWSWEKDGYGLRFLRYRVAGNAFLYHQVRSMVGTMVECALKAEKEEDFRARLDSCDRSLALKTYPSCGLYLARISYDDEEYRWFEDENGRESQ